MKSRKTTSYNDTEGNPHATLAEAVAKDLDGLCSDCDDLPHLIRALTVNRVLRHKFSQLLSELS